MDSASYRAAVFNGCVEAHGLHRSYAHYFVKFRTVARVLLETETRAFARYGHDAERMGPARAWDQAMRTMVDDAVRRLASVAPALGDPEPLIMEVLRRREARRHIHAVAVLGGGDPVPGQAEALAEAAHAFDEAAGGDGLTAEFAEIAWAQAGYAEHRPTIRAGGVEVYVYKHPVSRTRRIIARHPDGLEKVLVDDHKPNIVFPRVYPDGFWLEPTHGRHLVYSSQASGDESGAMLTVVDTHSAEELAKIKGADYPDVAWTSPTTFVWVGGAGKQHGIWRFDLTSGTRHMLRARDTAPYDPTYFREVVGSRHRQRGAQRPWVVVSENKGPHGSVNELTVIATETPTHRTDLLTFSDATLGRAVVTADDRLIVVGWSTDRPRGRIAEVPVDLDRRRIPPHEWRDLVPDDGRCVIREVVPVERGRARDPLLAISRTRHGAAEVQLFDPESATGTVLPLADLGLPAVHRSDGRREPGVFGQITGMTAHTGPDGTKVLEVEHSSIVSSPRTFRFALTARGGVGPAQEIPRERSIADVVLAGARVTRHTFRAPDNTEVRGVLVEHADAPGTGPLMFTSYSNFFVGNNTSKLFNHVHSTHFAAGGRMWFNEGRGTGSEGYQHFLDGVRENMFGAVMDVVAGFDYIIDQRITGPGAIHTSAQSAGPLIMMRAVAQRPEAVASASNRRMTEPWRQLATTSQAGAEYESRVAQVMSWSSYLLGTAGPKVSMVFGAPDDRRVPDQGAQEVAGLQMTTTTKTLLHVARPGNGHFADEQEAARELTVMTRTFGYPPPSEARPHVLRDIRSLRPSLFRGHRGQDLLPPARAQSRTAERVAAVSPNGPAGLGTVGLVAGQGLGSAADLFGPPKAAAGLPGAALINSRAHALQAPSGARLAPKYPTLRMEKRPGANRRGF